MQFLAGLITGAILFGLGLFIGFRLKKTKFVDVLQQGPVVLKRENKLKPKINDDAMAIKKEIEQGEF